MNNELPLSPYSRQWLGLFDASAGIHPHCNGERWLLHRTPSYPGAGTITVQIRWYGTHWQLLSISNAGDRPSLSQSIGGGKRTCSQLFLALSGRAGLSHQATSHSGERPG